MKKTLFVIITIISGFALRAQDTDTITYWKLSGLGSINFSQTSFSENWQAGGVSSIAGLGLLNLKAIYEKDKSSWENTLEIKYGLNQIKGEDFRKTDDILDFTSKYGYKANKNWYYSALLNFKTQLTNGFDPNDTIREQPISRFLSPAYIILSIGMDFKPNDNFSLFISPVTGKITIVNDDSLSNAGAFGVDPGKNVRYEFGASLKSTFVREIIKNVTFNSKASLFYNYLDDAQLDVDWEVLLNFKINEFLSANIITQLIYDKDQIDEVQFKEVFGIGFSYKF